MKRSFSVLCALAISLCSLTIAHAYPAQFTETQMTTGLANPTTMEFAPDGRLFVLEQRGTVRIVKNGTLLATPWLDLRPNIQSDVEKGLLGIAFDPQFTTNGYVYLYYTRPGSSVTHRVARFTQSASNPDMGVLASETVILDNIPGEAGNHNGGAIHFSPDGKLFIAVGDGGASPQRAQNLNILGGKLLRINKDGTIPSDNPFVNNASAKGEIWAMGFRNPFTFAIDPVDGRIYVNDVGQSTWEEVNVVTRGANYGWPTCEGVCSNPAFTNPIYAYNHATGIAITGGVFYRGSQFPSNYTGTYFFSDYGGTWIRMLSPTNQMTQFGNEAKSPIDFEVAPDGSLYYLDFNNGRVFRLSYTGAANRPPVAVASASPSTGPAPLSVTLSALGSSDPDGDALTYTWQFGDSTANQSGISVSHTYTAAGPYTATVLVRDSKGASAQASAPVSVGAVPQITISSPLDGVRYTAGDTIVYLANATDGQGNAIPPANISWIIQLHHDNHTHPALGPVSGSGGSYMIPREGHTEYTVWYRFTAIATAASGFTATDTADVLPRLVNLTVASSPAGVPLVLDGQPVTPPFTTPSVAGVNRSVTAADTIVSGTEYTFLNWSDGGADDHRIIVPGTSTTYTAYFSAYKFGDIDGDGHITIADVVRMFTDLGTTTCGLASDLNSDCAVNIFDFIVAARNWG